MKKIIMLLSILAMSTVLVGQSPCCKNKAPGTKCAKTAQVIDGEETQQMPACCKGKVDKGSSCSKKKQTEDFIMGCSQKKWWQFWKNGCAKSCCDKA